jgi:hypothetical protein
MVINFNLDDLTLNYYGDYVDYFCGRILNSTDTAFLSENNNLDVYVGTLVNAPSNDASIPTNDSLTAEIYTVVFGFKNKETPDC